MARLSYDVENVKCNQEREGERKQPQQQNQSHDRKKLCKMTPLSASCQIVTVVHLTPTMNHHITTPPKTSHFFSHLRHLFMAQTKEMDEAYVGDDVRGSGKSREGLSV